MSERESYSLPLFDPARTEREAWTLPQPVPTTLLALWPGSRPPLQEAIAEALVQSAPEAVVVGEMEHAPDESLWTIVVDLPGPIDGRAIVFAEPAQELPPGEFGASDTSSGAARADGAATPSDSARDARSCRFIVGIELLLPRDEPLRAFSAAMRLASALVPDAPAILDVASNTWHERRGIDRWFTAPDADPPEWILWTVHAASGDRDFAPGGVAWLRTSGLWRCGRPELEILEIPTEHMRAGIALLHGVAALLLDEDPPPPGARWSIGHDLDIALQPWQAVVPFLDPATPGSLATRQLDEAALRAAPSMHPLAGVRAVICAPEPRGTYRRLWTWPEAALRRLESGEAALAHSETAARRANRVAQRTLRGFIGALCRLRDAGAIHDEDGRDDPRDGSAAGAMRGGAPTLVVQTTFDAGGTREHLWIRALEATDEGIVGRVLNAPVLTTAVQRGERVTVPNDRIADWHVRCGDRTFAPDDAGDLLAAVEAWIAARAQPADLAGSDRGPSNVDR